MPWPFGLLWNTTASNTSDEPIPQKLFEAKADLKNKTTDLRSTASDTWSSSLNRTDYSHYTTPQTLLFSALTTATTLALVSLYKTRLRRIPGAAYLKPGFFRRRNLYGYVTNVGDGDNFRVFHTPGGKLMGWGWLRKIPENGKTKKGNKRVGETLHVRLAGVDAPECAHFGKPAQPFSQEALDWLRAEVGGRYVRVYPHRPDQYGRVVCTVWRRRWGGLLARRDIGEEMLKKGWATVYEAKMGKEFGGKEDLYREAEASAKERGVGMWSKPGLIGKMLGKTDGVKESPREFKTRMKDFDASEKK